MPGETLHTDKDLLRRVATGDEAAFEELFYQWQDKLYYFILRIVGSPERAEDALQDVFVKLWLRRAELAGVDNFASWLFKIAQNHAIDAERRLANETLILAELRASTTALGLAPDEVLLQKQITEKLRQAVESLAPQQRNVYKLSKEQGLQHEEVARILGLTVQTVRNTLSDAMRNIRAKMKDHYTSAPVYVALILLIFNE